MSTIYITERQLPGTYDFGTIDSSKYTGTITYIDVDTANGFWEFTGSGYAVGGGSFVSSSIDAMYVCNPSHVRYGLLLICISYQCRYWNNPHLRS